MTQKVKEDEIWKDAFEAAKEIESSIKKKKNEEKIKDEFEIKENNLELEHNSLSNDKKDKENKEDYNNNEVKSHKDDNSSNNELLSKYDELEKKYQAIKQDLENKDAQLKRLAADFDNFRRRQTQEKEDLIKYAYEKLFVDLLPILDNFERAINSSKDSKDISSIISGIEMIQKQLLNLMSKNGLEVINALGNVFDPNFHEAVQQVVDDEKESETIIGELQKGYTLNGRVIRPSMVVVSKKSNE